MTLFALISTGEGSIWYRSQIGGQDQVPSRCSAIPDDRKTIDGNGNYLVIRIFFLHFDGRADCHRTLPDFRSARWSDGLVIVVFHRGGSPDRWKRDTGILLPTKLVRYKRNHLQIITSRESTCRRFSKELGRPPAGRCLWGWLRGRFMKPGRFCWFSGFLTLSISNGTPCS